MNDNKIMSVTRSFPVPSVNTTVYIQFLW